MSLTVADHLARSLVARGFHRCFGYLGYHVEPLPQALLRIGLDVVIAASETGAGFMAQGWSLASGRAGLVFCAGGPGLAMLIPALQAARAEGFPLLAIIGQTSTTGLPSFQDTGALGSRDRELLDALQIPGLQIGSPQELPAGLDLVCDALAAGRPAALTIPADILAAPWSAIDGQSLLSRHAFDWHRPLTGWAVPADPLSVAQQPTGPGGYRAVVRALLATFPSGTLWFGDAGQARHAMRMEFEGRGLPLFDCPQSGPMGWAIAAAIGAAFHDVERPVCCFTGDGSAQMLAVEWVTAVQHHLPITFVLAVNRVLGGPYGRLQASGAQCLSHLPPVDWCGLAASMGLPARRVEGAQEIAAALEALPPRGPRLLELPLPARDPEVVAPYSLSPSVS
ncbi:MAG: thiamine pyrophosphate-binding protein [Cyanobacteria bacterium]|nr:thiamine pyrophosphate-binding protein [Cyanobacteriota bacterium]